MKGISILCEDSKVLESRAIGASLFGTDDLLKTPLSEKGSSPATHWYCFVKMKEIDYQNLLLIQKNCIIEESNPAVFLSKWKLKVIK